ncbi:MAG: ribosomal L7Ae/L30e/S12e/Gadd45 family protein [Ruminococcus sp.]|nr:ribosomal L7Ae/L30e/S12e/Gadd45 family protein [Ruminococcus sp.]
MDKLLNFLGLCRRAGKLTTGNDAVVETVQKGESKAVIIAGDTSPNTEKKLRKTCEMNRVMLIKLNRTKDEISCAIGKFAAVASVTDTGFAQNIDRLQQNETGGNSV